MGRRYAGGDVDLTSPVTLRSRMTRKCQVRFWRAAALARGSLTLILVETLLPEAVTRKLEISYPGEKPRTIFLKSKSRRKPHCRHGSCSTWGDPSLGQRSRLSGDPTGI